MRTVVNSAQVAHLWANQSQDYARNGSGSVSFDGPNLYSYRTTIAGLVLDRDGETVVLEDCRTHSIATSSKHMPLVHYASRHFDSYRVPNCAAPVSYSGHKANREHLVKQFRAAVASLKRAQYGRPYHDARRAENIQHLAQEAIEYSRRFNVRGKLPDFGAELEAVQEYRAGREIARKTPAAIRRRERAAEYRERRKERERRAAIERAQASDIAMRDEWDRNLLAVLGSMDDYAAVATSTAADCAARGDYDRNGWSTCRRLQDLAHIGDMRRASDARILTAFGAWDAVTDYLSSLPVDVDSQADVVRALEEETRYRSAREAIAAWRAGGTGSESLYHVPTMLRVKSDGTTVQTSRGAEVPLAHARRLYSRVAQCRARGESWEPHGEALRIGLFTVSAISADGTLRVGCHTIEWDEIERFAASQGWDSTIEHAPDEFVAETEVGQ